jgi:hypothetical protein
MFYTLLQTFFKKIKMLLRTNKYGFSVIYRFGNNLSILSVTQQNLWLSLNKRSDQNQFGIKRDYEWTLKQSI